LLVAAGLAAGLAAGWLVFGQLGQVNAGDDRHEDYVLSTGPISVGVVGPELDGVWLLDYRAGKLLGTVVNRMTGKISSWAEVDLVSEFGIPPRQNVHFMMTTGMVTRGQSALYVAETSTGKFGVYTMAADPPRGGVVIRRHDMVLFRAPKQQVANPNPNPNP
jgi:hypothetical protein